jgi:lipopolysaccharide/colanic/teichoic acid biosynthesis glycosyltransferase
MRDTFLPFSPPLIGQEEIDEVVDVYQNEILPAKLAIDLDYFSKRTWLSDLLLILRTIFSLFR